MDESWGLKSILDASDDVAVVIINARNNNVLYCNHFAMLKTGLHADSSFVGVWDDVMQYLRECNEGRAFRYCADSTPFGDNKNVTISRVVWIGGVIAYALMITNHLENEEEKDREIIFKALGKSYLYIQVLDLEDKMVNTIFRSDAKDRYYFLPYQFDAWKKKLLEGYVHEEDCEQFKNLLFPDVINKRLNEQNDSMVVLFRRKTNDDYRWTEMSISKVKNSDGREYVICTQRDIHGEHTVNMDKHNNDLIMQTLANAYRSVYLVDLENGEYSTVKPDELLFGIRNEGLYSELMTIVSEFIEDEGQKNNLNEYFSLEALKNAFDSGMDNIGKEYNSSLIGSEGWMAVSAFRPPVTVGLDDKCILTFMDITEHKRVERERNEKNIALDVLSSRYLSVFYVDSNDYSFNAIRLPASLRYMEKQFGNMKDLFEHYVSAYVLDDYKDMLRKNVGDAIFKVERTITEDRPKQEYLFKSIDDRWIRLSITIVPEDDDHSEYIVAFEDYTEIMRQNSISSIYGRMMLADYEHMYEYDPEKDVFYNLVYDGERLMRKGADADGVISLDFHTSTIIHPDDRDIFTMACKKETVDLCLNEGKTVTHLYIRRKNEINDEYNQYMYGFHYYQEKGVKYVLIMERDANREIV